MLNQNIVIPLLTIPLIIVSILLIFLFRMRNKKQLHKIFIAISLLLFFWFIILLLQILLSKPLNIKPIYFEYFIYISACLIPVLILIMSIIFANTKIKLTWKYKALFVLPFISLVILWTNNYHNLFYKYYSVNFRETIFGPYFTIHSIYSYACILLGIIYLISYSFKNSGFFSKQSLLICTGTIISLAINILATFGILNLSIYVTPISFTIAILFIALAIFKFNFLSVAPIALQRIVDRMSDAYLVLNEENIITDYNNTFFDIFPDKNAKIRNVNLFDLIRSNFKVNIDLDVLKDAINKVKYNNSTIKFEKHFPTYNKYFKIEINSISSKDNFLGTLILLKDVTQHNLDMQTIKENQDMLVEKERLASLGQMIGGIAHNLKTPIMSIAGATEGICDLIKEYDEAIGDPEVNEQDNHEIASDMLEWTEKIKTHLSYMSDVITAIKGQAVAFSNQTSNEFTIGELVKYVDILMKHELKNALVTLDVSVDIDSSTNVKGNINSLVQVVNNIISNAIQAYKGAPDKKINLYIYDENKDKLILKIQDYAGGLPDKVKDKLFKEMITTKGKNGTGLGLFMSYSNIRAHFNGNLKFESESRKRNHFLHRNTFVKCIIVFYKGLLNVFAHKFLPN